MSFFKNKQQQVNDFLSEANQVLGDNPLYFGGTVLTGKKNNPDVLFLDTNPAITNWDDTKQRTEFAKAVAYQDLPCKLITDLANKDKLASRVVEFILQGDDKKLADCAESNFVSCFGSPSVSVLNEQINALSSDLQEKHQKLMSDIISQVEPKHIVIMGLDAFDMFVSQHKIDKATMETRQMSYGKNLQRFYVKTYLGDITVHGVRHLTNSRPTKDMLAGIEFVFKYAFD